MTIKAKMMAEKLRKYWKVRKKTILRTYEAGIHRGSIWTIPGTPTKFPKYPPKQKALLYIIYKYTHHIYNIYKYITHNNILNINIADK